MLDTINKHWRLLGFGILMTFWSAPGQTFFISLFGSDIRASLELSHAEFGGLYSAATLLSALVILWSGRFTDSVPTPLLSRIVIVSLAFGMILLGASQHVLTLFIALFVLRQFGQSLMMLISSTTILRYLPDLRGKATALSSTGYIGAEALLPVLVVTASTFLDWRQTLFAVAGLLVISMFLAIPQLLSQYPKHRAEYLKRHSLTKSKEETLVFNETSQRQWKREEVLRDPRFYLLLPALLAQALLFTGFIFHQGFIVESKNWDWQWWAALFSIYAIISLVSKLIAGVMIDRFSAQSILPVSPIPFALGLSSLAMGDSNLHALGFFIGMGITAGIQTTLTGPILVELYGDKHLGATKSLISSLIAFATALTPLAMGIFIDAGASIELLAWSAVAYSILAITLVVIAYKTPSLKSKQDYQHQ